MPAMKCRAVFHFPLQREALALLLLMAQDTQNTRISQFSRLFSFGNITLVKPDNEISGIVYLNMKCSIINKHNVYFYPDAKITIYAELDTVNKNK